MSGLLDEFVAAPAEQGASLFDDNLGEFIGTVGRNVIPNPIGAYQAIRETPQSGMPLAIELATMGLLPASTLIGLAQILGAGSKLVGLGGSSEFGSLNGNFGP